MSLCVKCQSRAPDDLHMCVRRQTSRFFHLFYNASVAYKGSGGGGGGEGGGGGVSGWGGVVGLV